MRARLLLLLCVSVAQKQTPYCVHASQQVKIPVSPLSLVKTVPVLVHIQV